MGSKFKVGDKVRSKAFPKDEGVVMVVSATMFPPYYVQWKRMGIWWCLENELELVTETLGEAELRAENDKLKVELVLVTSKSTKDYDALKRDFDVLKMAGDNLAKATKDLIVSGVQLQMERDEAKSQGKELCAKIDALKAENDTFKAENARIRGWHSVDVGLLRKEVGSLKAENTHLQEALACKGEGCMSTYKELDKLKAKNAKLQEENKELRERFAKDTASIETLVQNRNGLGYEIVNLKAKLRELGKE